MQVRRLVSLAPVRIGALVLGLLLLLLWGTLRWLGESPDAYALGELALAEGGEVRLFADSGFDVNQNFSFEIWRQGRSRVGRSFFLSVAGGNFELRARDFRLLQADGVSALVLERAPLEALMLYQTRTDGCWPARTARESWERNQAEGQQLLARLQKRYPRLRARF
ncbi:MAG TPA: hypothetical protein V6D23_04120 [Candidatus Obscuribacterales bacterium]